MKITSPPRIPILNYLSWGEQRRSTFAKLIYQLISIYIITGGPTPPSSQNGWPRLTMAPTSSSPGASVTSPPAGEGGQDVSSAGGLPGVLPALEGVVFFTSDVGVAITVAVGESSIAGGAGVIRGSVWTGAGELAVVEELGEGAGWGWGGVGVTPSGLLSVGAKKKKDWIYTRSYENTTK